MIKSITELRNRKPDGEKIYKLLINNPSFQTKCCRYSWAALKKLSSQKAGMLMRLSQDAYFEWLNQFNRFERQTMDRIATLSEKRLETTERQVISKCEYTNRMVEDHIKHWEKVESIEADIAALNKAKRIHAEFEKPRHKTDYNYISTSHGTIRAE